MINNYSWNLSAGVTQPFCTFSDIFSDKEINNIIKIGESEVLEKGQVGSSEDVEGSLNINLRD